MGSRLGTQLFIGWIDAEAAAKIRGASCRGGAHPGGRKTGPKPKALAALSPRRRRARIAAEAYAAHDAAEVAAAEEAAAKVAAAAETQAAADKAAAERAAATASLTMAERVDALVAAEFKAPQVASGCIQNAPSGCIQNAPRYRSLSKEILVSGSSSLREEERPAGAGLPFSSFKEQEPTTPTPAEKPSQSPTMPAKAAAGPAGKAAGLPAPDCPRCGRLRRPDPTDPNRYAVDGVDVCGRCYFQWVGGY
jgi:hypothetical protein